MDYDDTRYDRDDAIEDFDYFDGGSISFGGDGNAKREEIAGFTFATNIVVPNGGRSIKQRTEDYIASHGKDNVIVRTNPIDNYGNPIGGDAVAIYLRDGANDG